MSLKQISVNYDERQDRSTEGRRLSRVRLNDMERQTHTHKTQHHSCFLLDPKVNDGEKQNGGRQCPHMQANGAKTNPTVDTIESSVEKGEQKGHEHRNGPRQGALRKGR